MSCPHPHTCPICNKRKVAAGRKWCDECVDAAVTGNHLGMHITIAEKEDARFKAEKLGKRIDGRPFRAIGRRKKT